MNSISYLNVWVDSVERLVGDRAKNHRGGVGHVMVKRSSCLPCEKGSHLWTTLVHAHPDPSVPLSFCDSHMYPWLSTEGGDCITH